MWLEFLVNIYFFVYGIQTKLSILQPVSPSAVNLVIGHSQETVELNTVVVRLDDSGAVGTVCPDRFQGAEAIVFCKQMNLGIGGRAYKVGGFKLFY